MTRFALITASVVLLVGCAWFAYRTGKFDILHRRTGWSVQVNSKPVRSDVLVGRGSALVTRRDSGNQHSYLIIYAGDIDPTGDIGEVGDCRDWIAPKLPILILTNSYPNCTLGIGGRVGLRQVGAAAQFTTSNGDLVSIR